MQFTLNGRPVELEVQPHETAVDVMRRLGIHGVRESCGLGACGCCTLLVDGVALSGCLLLGPLLEGTSVVTVEGLADVERLHPVQQAFVACSAFQCGFCTPGFVLMVERLLHENPHATDHEIGDYLAGNLCRCATYPDIVRAVRLAAERTKPAHP
ncbi:hypothetical protein AYO44_12035 [Planctomycetaceae bacterium SCGC AG-212-F19]|nr:hypothetical protein AYO44_12035 [Planctomycetaceae bacterium SCGC AG-212-F19]